MIKTSFFIFFTIIGTLAAACSGPAPGTSLNHNDLINTTETIVLAELVEGSRSRFRVIEILKGVSGMEFQWVRFRAKKQHVSNDFDGHSNEGFWSSTDETVIRSPFHSGACLADFTFVVDEKYLIFVESYGNHHAAEIIKSAEDKWYQFVKQQLIATQSGNKAKTITH